MTIWTRITLLFVAGILFVVGAYLSNWDRTRELQRQLAEAHATLEQIHIEHKDTLDAITQALDAREAIREQARLQKERAKKIMEKDPLAATPLSDALRMCIQWDHENSDCKVYTPGHPATGHSDPGQVKSGDSR